MAEAVIPSPPRLTGDYAADSAIMAQWFSEFYKGLTAAPAAFDPDNLVPPTAATISSAQQTANEAYQLAKQLSEEP